LRFGGACRVRARHFNREALKQEQLKWLTTREPVTAAEPRDRDFIQLNFTRRIVNWKRVDGIVGWLGMELLLDIC
jgi:hypothetical protein